MSITNETAKQHENDPAITCCRFEGGSSIDPSNLEDPAIFPDLVDSGLLTIPDNCLKIGEVLGGKLTKTVDALTPLTPDLVDGASSLPAKQDAVAEQSAPVAVQSNNSNMAQTANAGVLKISIGEGKNINLEIPMGGSYAPSQTVAGGALAGVAGMNSAASTGANQSERVLRTLERKYFKISEIKRGSETKLDGTTLYIRDDIEKDAVASEELVVKLKMDIITPEKYSEYSETIMDVQPIATKEDGDLGEGVTRVLDGTVFIVTGTDENGVQIGEFGSSEGRMDRNIMWGRPGSPDKGEIFIKTEVVIKAGTNMERRGPLAAHKASDVIVDEIRQALKKAEASLEVRNEKFEQVRRPGKTKVLICKEIMGQGAMHDNLILPLEPVGTLGAKPNVDLGNVPVMLSPLEVLDGGIHALTCIGPASKETSRHYFREPLVLEAMADPEIDLCGVLFVGSPQVNSEKFYVSRRLGMAVEAVNPDGVIITTEGFGNNHIDFAAHHEEVGKRGIPVVGMTFSAVQGALVVGNEYMKNMVDNNKSQQGIENEILENNCMTSEDAIRALSMLKSVIAGEEVKAAERKWNRNVKLNNIAAIEKELGTKIELVENEQVLEKSKKRAEIYEKE
ncbi:MAG: D-proline reductase (dithiol) proprotein PrdA [Treponema sp.]|nr:MAG: D-proline reductase (dithiol) proprotein PrdA [Treponema sp.]